jgi:hypothetical protein
VFLADLSGWPGSSVEEAGLERTKSEDMCSGQRIEAERPVTEDIWRSKGVIDGCM